MPHDQPTCCCYLDDDRFPCPAVEHEDLEDAMAAVLREARACARFRYQETADDDESATEWTRDICDIDLDTTAQEIGRTLSNAETAAFDSEFRRRFAELCAG